MVQVSFGADGVKGNQEQHAVITLQKKLIFGGFFHFCFEASWANLFVINSVESTNLAAQFDKQSSFFLPRLLLIELVPTQVSQQTSVMLCIWVIRVAFCCSI